MAPNNAERRASALYTNMIVDIPLPPFLAIQINQWFRILGLEPFSIESIDEPCF
jgi:hypothetical protein